MTSVDTDVSSYTISELMAIIEVTDIDPEEIVQNTNVLINKFKDSNPQLSVFFKEVQSQLLQYSQGLLAEKEEDTSGKSGVGGMVAKLKEAFRCTKRKLRVAIAGYEKDVILKFAKGESVGTKIGRVTRLKKK